MFAAMSEAGRGIWRVIVETRSALTLTGGKGIGGIGGVARADLEGGGVRVRERSVTIGVTGREGISMEAWLRGRREREIKYVREVGRKCRERQKEAKYQEATITVYFTSIGCWW